MEPLNQCFMSHGTSVFVQLFYTDKGTRKIGFSLLVFVVAWCLWLQSNLALRVRFLLNVL